MTPGQRAILARITDDGENILARADTAVGTAEHIAGVLLGTQTAMDEVLAEIENAPEDLAKHPWVQCVQGLMGKVNDALGGDDGLTDADAHDMRDDLNALLDYADEFIPQAQGYIK